ncbi:hypothetical protein P170DRAFT_368985 [Aspergillus steynii IBT 23096]|uniref:Uncharacterized protein n=1 Tax=Aspergillus steynii IBT 23096 TaxID=1392250 RepID=A0A2I2FTD0_9EURO|nr:uncharacterized protein P170DRAFT_368985 [Aspergillus steynii IBT 23096]PLB43861.1 hypothetical protein P170DRAFT_368985 [Aspergillus steynii IBT 23096]
MAPEIGKPVFPSTPTSPELSPDTRDSPTPSKPSLYHHSLVTSDFDALRFHAAAALQLQYPSTSTSTTPIQQSLPSSTHLIASPYNSPPHLLDLTTLDTPNRLLALALSILKPVRDDYATAPYADALNWPAVFSFLRDLAAHEGFHWPKSHFYVVVFRSRLQDGIDHQRLHDLDAYSHQEATVSGGLLKYWFGAKNERRENLATCLWRTRQDARAGGTGPWHKKARGAARDMYEQITFTTLKLEVGEGVTSWGFGDWTEEDE